MYRSTKSILQKVFDCGQQTVVEAQEAVDFVQSVQQEEVAKARWEFVQSVQQQEVAKARWEQSPMLVDKTVTLEALRRWQQKKTNAYNMIVVIVFFEMLEDDLETHEPTAKRVRKCGDPV